MHPEKHLLQKAGLHEEGADDYVQGGKLARKGVKVLVILLARVFPGKGIPEFPQLGLGQMEEAARLLQLGVHVAQHKEVADVKHRVPPRKAVQVNPIVLLAGDDEVPHLEVPVHAGPAFQDALGKTPEPGPHLAAQESSPINGPEHLLLAAGEHLRVAGRGKHLLAFGTEELRHLGNALGLVAANARQGLLTLNKLCHRPVRLPHLHHPEHPGNWQPQARNGSRNFKLAPDRLLRAQPLPVHLQNHPRLGLAHVCLAVATFPHLLPGRKVNLLILNIIHQLLIVIVMLKNSLSSQPWRSVIYGPLLDRQEARYTLSSCTSN